jgi:uncharacterized membrane protein
MDKYTAFYSQEERSDIISAIQRAEAKTSGEIRVHLEDHCDHESKDRAAMVFEKLGMHKTADRNGVLFYVAVCDHDFAVIGDAGIHEKVGAAYWQDLCNELEEHFRAGRYKGGLVKCIDHVGEQLKSYYPVDKRDVNELVDDISMGHI